MKKILLLALLSVFFVSGCANKKQKSDVGYENNNDAAIHYIGDQSVFSN